MKFPDYQSAPARLQAIDGNCGLLAAWGVLTHFGKRTTVRQLVTACRYTKTHGVFTIALALALHERGLKVAFHSDHDPKPHRIERACYARALAEGLPVKAAISIASLLRSRGDGKVAVVFYNTDQNTGHFSPLLGLRSGKLILPYSDDGVMDIPKFVRCWREPEVLRQCLLVENPKSGVGVPDPAPDSVFITAYQPRGKALTALRRRHRRKS